ncbi:hypothetical protein GN278_02680 [Rhodobacteraceae bacterium Araon29]
MNETIPYKEAYQTNRHRMCWAALGMMIAFTIATIHDPVRPKGHPRRRLWLKA